MKLLSDPLDWRSCEYVSMANASRIAGRSAGWARGAVTAGDLDVVYLPTGGPPVVTVASLARLLDGTRPLPGHEVGPGRRPVLRLVHSNS